MKSYFLAALMFFTLTASCFAQDHKWDKWNWLMGTWKGEVNGQPGKGGGTFSFAPDLDQKILVRKSHSEYPASAGKPKIVHDDLMVVYLDMTGIPSKAIYFDNEGHTIQYTISSTDKEIVFVSDKTPHVPVFRLTYTLLDNSTINTKFEMSPDGEKFMTYIEGRSKKTE